VWHGRSGRSLTVRSTKRCPRNDQRLVSDVPGERQEIEAGDDEKEIQVSG
jgi:hypothetical protein